MKRLKEFTRKPDTTEYAAYILRELDALIDARDFYEVEVKPLDLLPVRRALMDLYAEMLAEDKEWYYAQPLKVKVRRWFRQTFKWSFL